MKEASDGVVSAGDLARALDEILHGKGEQIMGRLFQTEPHLAVYIESIALHFKNEQKHKKDHSDTAMDPLEHILVIIRALELGHHRLWKDVFPPDSPMAKLIDPGSANPKKQPKK